MQVPRLSGILTALATPYDDIGSLDLKALDKLVEFLVSNGVHALIPGGSTGEYYSQTLEEFTCWRTAGNTTSTLNMALCLLGSRSAMSAPH